MVAIKCIVICFVIGIVSAIDNLRIIDSIKQEQSCAARGGTCTVSTDCGLLVEESGLCPLQQRMGVECCYGISKKETRCRKRGGECMSGCNKRLQTKLATDCPEKSVCCILVY